MAVNIGPRIGIEGEAEYRKQINNITQAQKTLDAEMKATSAAFDENTTAQEKNAAKAKNLQQQVDNQKKKVEQLKHMTEQSAQKFGENSTQTLKWREALANAETELARMNTELDKVSKSDFSSKMQSAGQSLETLGGKMASVGDWMTTNITQPLMDVGKYCTDAYKEVDSAMDIIVKKTGATGEELEDMKKTAKDIAKTIPVSFEKSAKAVGEVNTRFGVTGEELEDLSTYFLEFSELNGTDVSQSVDDVSKAMKALGVDTKDAKKVLDIMNATGQRTGVSMSTLSGSMVKNAASLQEMGMDVYQATQFLGDLEMSGADAATVMTGLQKAMINAAEEGKTLPEALSEFQSVMDSSATDQDKLNAAIKLFGKKAGPAIYNACKNGSLSFASLDDDAQKHMGNVETTYENTLGPDSKIVTTMNSLKETGAQIGETLLTILAPAVKQVGEYIGKLGKWYNSLDADTQRMVSKVGIALGVGGPLLSGVGSMVSGIGSGISTVGSLLNSIGGISTAAGPVAGAIAALGALAAAWYFTPIERIEGYDDFMNDLDAINKKVEEIDQASDEAGKAISKIIDNANSDSKPLDEIYTQLKDCFDESGNLKEGMEATAAYLVGEFNQQMGTDFSTEFGNNAEKNLEQLAAMNTSLETYIENLKKAAVQKAFDEQFGDAVLRQTQALQAEDEAHQAYNKALAESTAANEAYAKANADAVAEMNQWGSLTPNTLMNLKDLRDAVDDNALKLEAAGQTWANAGGEAEQAGKQVEMMQEAISAIASGDTEKGVKIMASLEETSAKAGDTLKKKLAPGFKYVVDQIKNWAPKAYLEDIEAPKLIPPKVAPIGKEIVNDMTDFFASYSPTLSLRKSKVVGASEKGNEAKEIIERSMQNLAARIGMVNNTSGAASSAWSSMQSIIGRGMTGNVSSVSFWDAVQSAWSSMQNWLNDNPLTSWVRQVTTNVSNGGGLWNSIWGHADGGIMTSPHVGLVAEAGPEAIIPLSSARRGRAMSLYREVGGILGVGSGSVTSNTNNSVNINVYASPTQTADEIAEVVSRKINTQLRRKGAVFA